MRVHMPPSEAGSGRAAHACLRTAESRKQLYMHGWHAGITFAKTAKTTLQQANIRKHVSSKAKNAAENVYRQCPRQPGCIGQTGRTGRVTASLGEWSVIQKPAEKHRAINCEPTQHAATAGIPDSFSGPRHYCNPDLSPHTEILPCREPQEAPAA